MRPQNLREFAEDMRRKGDIRESDLADEILCLADIESDVAEPYGDLCEDLCEDIRISGCYTYHTQLVGISDK